MLGLTELRRSRYDRLPPVADCLACFRSAEWSSGATPVKGDDGWTIMARENWKGSEEVVDGMSFEGGS